MRAGMSELMAPSEIPFGGLPARATPPVGATEHFFAPAVDRPMDMDSQSSWMPPTDTGLAPLELLPADEGMEVIPEGDFPPRCDVPYLGTYSQIFSQTLRDMIGKELADWQFYRSLARRVGGSAARMFSSMASDDWHAAKRLAGVFFLMTGEQYWPEKQGKVSIPSYHTALRERFVDEQQDAAAYVAAATECEDSCLCELFLELADENLRHVQQLRLLAEQI